MQLELRMSILIITVYLRNKHCHTSVYVGQPTCITLAYVLIIYAIYHANYIICTCYETC
jgi:hypothetical protein